LVTAAVLTTAAVGRLAEIHERMPLLLAADDWAAWLDPDSEAPRSLLRPPSDAVLADLEVRPVSAEVNNVAHNGPALVTRLSPVELTDPVLPLDLPVKDTFADVSEMATGIGRPAGGNPSGGSCINRLGRARAASGMGAVLGVVGISEIAAPAGVGSVGAFGTGVPGWFGAQR
jgi:hypothetical protein